MDWIKVLNKHVLHEYNDLSDSEFRAWVMVMSLTAHLEHIPTRVQMLQYVHYKTLDSLEKKLNTHSIDLQYVLNKVSIDAQYVLNRREDWKKNSKKYRDSKASVIDDVIMTSSVREEKRREEKNKHIERENPPTPQPDPPPPPEKKPLPARKTIPPTLEMVTAYCLERKNGINPSVWWDHYQSKGWRIGKEKMVDWQAAVRTWETKRRSDNDRPGNSGSQRAPTPKTGRSGSDDAPYPTDILCTE